MIMAKKKPPKKHTKKVNTEVEKKHRLNSFKSIRLEAARLYRDDNISIARQNSQNAILRTVLVALEKEQTDESFSLQFQRESIEDDKKENEKLKNYLELLGRVILDNREVKFEHYTKYLKAEYNIDIQKLIDDSPKQIDLDAIEKYKNEKKEEEIFVDDFEKKLENLMNNQKYLCDAEKSYGKEQINKIMYELKYFIGLKYIDRPVEKVEEVEEELEEEEEKEINFDDIKEVEEANDMNETDKKINQAFRDHLGIEAIQEEVSEEQKEVNKMTGTEALKRIKEKNDKELLKKLFNGGEKLC
jgi:hypothetical protein